MADDEPPASATSERMNGTHSPVDNGVEPRIARSPTEPFGGGGAEEDEDRLATLMNKSRKDTGGDESISKPDTADGSPAEPSNGKPPGKNGNGNRKRKRSKSNGRRKPAYEADTWISPDVRARRSPPPRRGGRGQPEEMYDSWVAERDRYRGWERDPRTNYWMPPSRLRERDDRRDPPRRRDSYDDDDIDDRRGGPRRRRPSPPPFERSRGRRGPRRGSVDEIRAEPMSVVSEKLLARR
ncbi:hypothetical protein SISSUDRAFT_1055230 [Sistotremastrum suecicum HHB10207 ss-3]|uniref:Uncharacterized protein n=1 Tax=Sistotremastrum suecicum HHB10207 ss-3 TaxID=1314776 RepID=A0A165XY75_9AGAM|nr:hypothetical protein SISSUDRAFT_1055230 [Sistotremastrum suecicum HHB10207 ss-3]